MNAFHSKSCFLSQSSPSSSARSYGPRRLQRTRYWGGATVEIGSICRRPRRRTVASTSCAEPSRSCARTAMRRASAGATSLYRWCARYSRRSVRVSTPIGFPPSRDHDRVRPAAAQRREDLVQRLVRVDRGQRRLHRGGDVLVQRVRVLEHAVEEISLLERPDHVRERVELAVAHDRELRDRVALHEVDRLADLLVRRDRDQVRDVRLLGLLRAQHLVDARRRRVALEEAELEHVVVVVELREVRRGRCPGSA